MRYLLWFTMLVLFLLLCACASTPARTRDNVTTVTIGIPTPIPCEPKRPPELIPPDTDEALALAPNVYEAVKLLMAGRAIRKQQHAEDQIALASCAKPVSK